jgi:hypothetical protein
MLKLSLTISTLALDVRRYTIVYFELSFLRVWSLTTYFLGAKSTSIRDCVGWSVRRSVGPLVRPHDAIMWKTSYIAIASRIGGGREKLVTSRFLCT